MSRILLLGDEAIASGAVHAGLSGVYAYPGTPSTEITEYIQADPLAKSRAVRCKWCTNEKTAMEAALGMSYAGKRALVCMKHVGMNVCADAFVNGAITGVNGGLVVLAADDPSMHSSQNEQDSRFYAKFAMIPVFEPSDQQEAYDMMGKAFDLSENLRIPVMVRIVTRLAHSRAAVEVSDSARPENPLNPSTDSWVLLPGNARRKYAELIAKQPELEKSSASSEYNSLEKSSCGKGTGIIACGIAFNYVKEVAAGEYDILKISRYPIPEELVRELASRNGRILVIEDGQPVVEEQVKGIIRSDIPVCGRLTGDLPRTGELTPDKVSDALGKSTGRSFGKAENLAARPPQFCKGCGHRDVFTALNKVLEDYPGHRVFGDIGCYTLGALPPFKSLSSCVDMGASITMAKGAADAGLFPSVAVIGDSTFTHSGMTGLLDAVICGGNITVVISDNLTTGMTGGQDSAGTNRYEAICEGIGVAPEHIRVVDPVPANMPEITRIIKEEIEYDGVSVIIPRRECMQTLRRHLKEAKKQQQ
ncbi:MAG: thiamine pyrophosphate-dependent enzyme [Candidatus Cryptobacteroides sp.]